VIDVIRELQSFGTNVDVFDPQADSDEVKHEYDLTLVKSLSKKYHAVVLAVSHKDFESIDWSKITDKKTVIYDVKGLMSKSLITARL
jgi:UDP-N-acetyl-D-galactosamine dehydrogenase